MKRLLWLFVLGALIFAAGCRSTKMAADDVDVYNRYKEEIEILQKSGGSNTKEKYDAASTLANELDFSYVRDIQTLFNVLGRHNAQIEMRFGRIKAVCFVFAYEKDSILFNFPVANNTVLTCELVRRKQKDKDIKNEAPKPEF